MSRLVLSLNDAVLADHNMKSERFSIGRLPGNDLRIEHPAISGHHALIVNILDDSFIEDLNSTNGTYVNGTVIKRHALQHGDLITLGFHQLRFIRDDADEERAPYVDTTVLPPDIAAAAVRAPLATPTERPTTGPAPAQLRILDGPSAGRTLILSKSLTTLGRPDLQVAAITRTQNRYYLSHIESTGKDQWPLVNDARIGPDATELEDQDIITVAGVKMSFYLD
jgi:pSer/pThr/pTyr-binding forkhead associated (FHA) protein